MTALPGANASAWMIHAAPSLPLGFGLPSFFQTFCLVALGGSLLTTMAYLYLTRLHSWWPRLGIFWQYLTTNLLTFRPAVPPTSPRWEKRVIAAIFVLSAVVQFNAVLHDGAMGQDYPTLFNLSKNLVDHPERPWNFGPQDPPVFVLTNAFFIWITGGVHAEAVCGIFNLLTGLVALWFFYLLSRRFIGHQVLRLTLVTLVAFLPLRLIHAVVLAGDGPARWPFLALAWVLALITDEATTTKKRRDLALLVALLLTVGVLTKYTFMSAIVAVFLTLFQLARRRRISWREAALVLMLSLSLPVAVVWTEMHFHSDFSGAMNLERQKDPLMSWRDILWLDEKDPRIFQAPRYDAPFEFDAPTPDGGPHEPNPTYELLYPHRYSYLALNHLAIFTDIMNIFQYDPTDSYFGQRSARNRQLMALAVKTAAPITLLCVVCMGLLSVLSIGTGVVGPGRSRPDLEAVYLLAFGWFSNIIVFLPFIPPAYIGGFWTPRLTMQGLLLFLLFTAYVLERLIPERARTPAAWVMFVYVAYQSALHVSFLWPWGKM